MNQPLHLTRRHQVLSPVIVPSAAAAGELGRYAAMPLVRIDARQIRDWDTFHNVFEAAFGFPGFYGRNMNAWIDCMGFLDEPGTGMTKVHGSASDPIVLRLDNVGSMPSEIYEELVECAAFVNWRRTESGDPAILVLAFYKAA